MEVLRDGTFVYSIESGALARGLRSSKRSPRNTKFLVQCVGAVGIDNVLQVIDDLETSRIDTSVVVDAFPYPQVFVFTNLIIICGRSNIYEYVGGSLDLKITVANGELWSAVDFYEYIYMSNKTVSVIRDATSKIYSATAILPKSSAMCDFNGQVIVGGL